MNLGLFRVTALSVASATLVARLGAATFTVVTTTDAGAGSLREAILDANGAGGANTIDFAIPGSGPHTITPVSALPDITSSVTIDGTTQPGFAGVPLIEIDGTNLATPALHVIGGFSTVRGLVINRATQCIQIDTDGPNVIEGNYLGTDPTGAIALGCTHGILVNGATGGRVGGTTVAQRNLISGNSTGIVVTNGSSALIQGNYIGTDASGKVALGNDLGISIASNGSTIGGDVAGAGNVISGNAAEGIRVASSNDVSILGNLIGTDATGQYPLGNQWGIAALGATGLVIGGAAGNVISGNIHGISLSGVLTGATIQGNFIGTDSSGTLALGNTQTGISLETASVTDNLIGGGPFGTPGQGNVIAFNGGDNVYGAIWNKGVRNTIRGNSIYSNANLGIDNDPGASNVVEANDDGDADVGANLLQNFPIVTAVITKTPQGTGTRIQGVLHSAPSTTYLIDFYANPACSPRPGDFLEGRTYLGGLPLDTDGSGTLHFDVTFFVPLEPNPRITTTATDPEGNTSEFSQRIVFASAPPSGTPAGGTIVTLAGTNFAAGATVTIGGAAATGINVDSAAQITATTPQLPVGTVNDVTVTNTDGTLGTLEKGWVADFLDVPPAVAFYSYIIKVVSNGITVGIGGGLYGVNDSTLRQQMAVFLLKGKYGICYVPPPCAGVFPDVPCPSTFAPWIEDLAAQGITGGCGGGNYCPQNPVRRDQMAAFLLKAKYGSSHTPPPCAGVFGDVACPSLFADWIEELAAEQITGGCGGGNYCPLANNTRGQMAVFLVKTFGL